MTGFVILPDHQNSEPVAVEPVFEFVQLTVGDGWAHLTADEARQLAAALLRAVER